MPYPDSHHYDDTFEPEESASDSSFMFTSLPQHTPHPLYSTSTHDSPQGWPPYDQSLLPPFQSQPLPYRGFPTPAPYPAPRLSSPLNTAGGGHVTTNVSRLSLAGSLDPTTGIFYRTPEHPRLRTAQACEKCRTRKAKCSGEHPSCKRCINRGLVCEYAKEGRVRGPNKSKNVTGVSSSSVKNVNVSATADFEQPGESLTLSATSSITSVEQAGTSSLTSDRITAASGPSRPLVPSEERSPPTPSIAPQLNTLSIHSPTRLNFTPLSQHPSPSTVQMSQDLYSLPNSSNVSSEASSRRNSITALSAVGLGEHRASRPRPPNLSLDATGHWRPGSMGGSHPAGWTSQPNSGLNLNDLAAELPMDFQTTQRQYERQCLVRQQHQRFLQEQRRFVTLQQNRMLQHQQDTPTGLDYQDIHRHSSSLSGMMSAPPLQRANPGLDSIFQTQYQVYNPTGQYDYQRAMEYPQGPQPEIRVQGYSEEPQVASAVTHQESYQRATTGLESAEQGLHPSLSRIEKRSDSLTGVATGGEHPIGTCPPSMSHGHGGMAGNTEPASCKAWYSSPYPFVEFVRLVLETGPIRRPTVY
ncbi:hypothetical protein D9756_010046 [Leucocoprinus leucothites]|uniref:Zn(2)-C6 fungal-type domain-containing protein n=1 Tax=Leucocoprinus leucothites TaxID=201217 RepID=A0A8H5FRJ1_9AGAR|nr:hypothetical protein D9756_010046 [Leucoagaricus leucothites]